MTTARERDRRRDIPAVLARIRAFAATKRGLLAGFAVFHVAYLAALAPVVLSGGTEGDLPLYRLWAIEALRGHWQVFDEAWVYPAGALGPIMAAIVLGPWAYQLIWLALMAAGNLAAIAALTGGFRRVRRYPAAWYWLLVQLLLAPVSMLRLEGAAAPFAIAALVWVVRMPAGAGALIAAATWIKVWPAALAAAAVTVVSARWRVVAGGLAVTAGIAGVVAAGGGGRNLFSFATIQTDRSLQLEAPVATPWVWGAVLGVPGSRIRQNYQLATREVVGSGAHEAGQVIGWLMSIAVAVILALLWFARRRASREQRLTAALEQRLVVRGAFALTAALIVFNKVGSPQYLLWLAPIAAVGLAIDPAGWRRIATWLAMTCLLTTLVFPILYLPLIEAHAVPALVLLARNALLVALLSAGVAWLVRAALPVRREPVAAGVDAAARG